MRKIIFCFILVILLLLIFPVTKSAYENISTDNETFLEVTVKVFGRWRIYFIITIVKNLGEEKVEITHCSVGGGFEIHNSDQRVYWTPKFPLRIASSTTLYPKIPTVMFWRSWFGFDDFGKILPKGEYNVRGVVWTQEFGTLYSEPVGIFLGKP